MENAKNEENLEKKMFPQMFELSSEELITIKGGNVDCDAVCSPSEWDGPCNCLDNLA